MYMNSVNSYAGLPKSRRPSKLVVAGFSVCQGVLFSPSADSSVLSQVQNVKIFYPVNLIFDLIQAYIALCSWYGG
eukprot:c22224_g1_i1 orf=280-504(+)